CHYCNRKYDCANESRPGVVSEKLTPDEGRRKVIAVANAAPQLSVLGIAGPGDACSTRRGRSRRRAHLSASTRSRRCRRREATTSCRVPDTSRRTPRRATPKPTKNPEFPAVSGLVGRVARLMRRI